MDTIDRRAHLVKSDLRGWLAGQLRRAEVPDWLWNDLSTNGALELGQREILQEARRRIRVIRASKPDDPVPAPPQIPRPSELLTHEETDRAWAFSEYIAGLAAADHDLQRFRDRCLGGQILSQEEAVSFLGSEALLYLSVDSLQHKGVPVWGHEVLRCELKSGPVKDPARPPQWKQEVDIEIAWKGHIERFSPWTQYSPGGAPDRKVHLPHGEGWFPFTVWNNSVYDEVRVLTESLVKQFPWNEPEATMYALTGKMPFIPPIYVVPSPPMLGAVGHVKVTISVEPWVSARSVLRFYKHIKNASYSGRSRALSAKNVALFRFVTRYARPGRDIPSFESLMKVWNSKHPGWLYDNAWVFARDYRRVGDLIIFPRYRFGTRKRRSRGSAKTTGGGGAQ
jgi:hypothetical protein